MAQSVFMKKLRDKMRIIFFIVAALFVGMMVFQWGMDIGGSTFSNKNIIAVVKEGKKTMKVDYADYNKEVENQVQNLVSRSQNVDDFVSEDLREQAFHTLVNRELLAEQFKLKRTEGATGKEIYERLKRNPPDWIQKQPGFLTNGQFDYKKYLTYLDNPQVDWRPVEQAVSANLPFDKLRTLIATVTYITKFEVRDQFLAEKTKIKGEYIVFDPEKIIVPIDTTEAVLRKYYDENKTKLNDRDFVKFKYVSIDYLPSAKDSAEAESEIKSVKERLDTGDEFENLATIYSDDLQTAQNGGELGYIRRGMLVPEFEAAATKLDSGQVSAPVKTMFGWHVIKSLGRHIEIDSLSKKADTLWHVQHILVRVQPGIETDDSLSELAKQIREEAISAGIEKAAQKHNLQLYRTPEIGAFDPIPGIGLRTMLNTFAMHEGIGSVPEVTKSNGKYFILQTEIAAPKTFRDFTQARDFIKYKLSKAAREERAKIDAASANARVQNGESFAEVAKAYGAQYDTTGMIGVYENTGAAGFAPRLTGALSYVFVKGMLTPPLVDSDGKVYIGKLIDRIDAKMEEYSTESERIRQGMYRAKRDNAYQQWFSHLRQGAQIEDMRLDYFGSVAEAKTK